jgi:hypothetical protein
MNAGTSRWRTSLASLEAGGVYRNLVVSGADLGGWLPVHSAYIPRLATSGGFWRHTPAHGFDGGWIVFPGQCGFGLVAMGAPAGFEPALTAPETSPI